jgi:hypothetical protein
MEEIYKRGRDALLRISKDVIAARKPPPGPYAFFHHNGHALARLEDCHRLYRRMDQGRAELTQLAYEEDEVRPRDWPAGVPYPEEVQRIITKSHEGTQLMELDLESLYLFGGILLDQWAFLALAVDGKKSKRGYAFAELIELFESNGVGVVAPLWPILNAQMLWLHYQLRFYRNRFIVHADRPWQRGTTMSVYGDDFNLHTPTPPGWLDDAKLDAEIATLMHLAPQHIRAALSQYGAGRLIEVLFDTIATYPKADREKISRLYGQKGGSTPNFRILAKKLFTFIADGTEALFPIAVANAGAIALGEPHQHSGGRPNS